jgi:hypothetical protein
MEDAMIPLNFIPSDMDELNDLRFPHPDPIVRKRRETVSLKAKKTYRCDNKF